MQVVISFTKTYMYDSCHMTTSWWQVGWTSRYIATGDSNLVVYSKPNNHGNAESDNKKKENSSLLRSWFTWDGVSIDISTARYCYVSSNIACEINVVIRRFSPSTTTYLAIASGHAHVWENKLLMYDGKRILKHHIHQRWSILFIKCLR